MSDFDKLSAEDKQFLIGQLGAIFLPGERLTLPTGRELSVDEVMDLLALVEPDYPIGQADEFKKLWNLIRMCPICGADLVVSTSRITTRNPDSMKIEQNKVCPDAHVTLDIVPNPIYSDEGPSVLFTPEDVIFREE